MRVIIAGGTGFLGSKLKRHLEASGHEVRSLTRRRPVSRNQIAWDGRSQGEWARHLEETDAVVQLTGHGLEHWPWTRQQKQHFLDSRVIPGKTLAAAIAAAHHKPATLLQITGISYYGSAGDGVADETWPPADDFLAQLAVHWEEATSCLDGSGVRQIAARTAVVLDAHGGLFPLMALPVRLFFGGPMGSGKQAVPWIHIQDQLEALRFLLETPQAAGAFNLVAPQPTTNAEFMRATARALKRPYWFPMPGFLLRLVLGEMSTLLLEGRFTTPRRLGELGFRFRYPTIDAAVGNLFGTAGVS
jgi:uncharacterized protein (TIGR01777 family)